MEPIARMFHPPADFTTTFCCDLGSRHLSPGKSVSKTAMAQIGSSQAHINQLCHFGLGGCPSPSSMCPVSTGNLGRDAQA